jgi:polyphosphate kinase 2
MRAQREKTEVRRGRVKPDTEDGGKKLKRKGYEKELRRLQVELCHLQAWVKQEGLRVIVVFEGRDGAGKGGTIRALTERVSPRVFRLVALPAPSDREKSQMYLQRYMAHFPSAGEVVIFDRSWYNRAGVERVMGFCSDEQYERFLELAPWLRSLLSRAASSLIKYWLEVSNEEQERRFKARIEDPVRQWKLSPMDLPSRERWYDYSRARDADARSHRHEALAVVHRALRRQEACAAQLHLAPAQSHPLQEAAGVRRSSCPPAPRRAPTTIRRR